MKINIKIIVIFGLALIVLIIAILLAINNLL